MRGILRFCQTHQCNNICRYLDLPPINPKQMDSGTVCVRSPLQNLTNSVTNHGVQSGHAMETALPKKTQTRNRESKPLSSIDTNANDADHKNQIRAGGKENTVACTQKTSSKRQLVPKPFKENHYFTKDEDLSRHLVLSGNRRSRVRTLGVRPRDAPTCSTCVVM